MLDAVLLGMISRRDVVRALRRAARGERASHLSEKESKPWTIPPSSVR
jgi:hypothetical protein